MYEKLLLKRLFSNEVAIVFRPIEENSGHTVIFPVCSNGWRESRLWRRETLEL